MVNLYSILLLGTLFCVGIGVPYSPCSRNPCQNNGQCVIDENYVYCICPEGFSGPACGRISGKRDSCDPNPCPRGASCTPDGDEAHCTCPSGWAGKLCEIKIDIYNCLDRNPCLNKRSLDQHLFFYRHDDPESYVVCSEAGECNVEHCQPGMLWDQKNLECSKS